MGPEALAQVLRPLRETFGTTGFADLLSGIESPDDAAVWRLDAERALVLTADFFPPVVDDPYHFGAVAAANSLSDLYAMGADPLFAINLVGFPDDLDVAILTEILRGGAEKIREAGGVIAGGHTTVDKEPKYGLAAVGIVHPEKILTKGGARVGDVLLLTKPLGTGVVTTAHKRQKADAADLAEAIESMERLSKQAARILRDFEGATHALTDVTGFALAGHAHEMAHQSGLGIRLRWDEIPRFSAAERYARAGFIAGGLRRNERYYGAWTTDHRGLSDPQRMLLYDPQTSGGLLASVDRGAAERVVDAFRRAAEPVWVIGEAFASRAGAIEIV